VKACEASGRFFGRRVMSSATPRAAVDQRAISAACQSLTETCRKTYCVAEGRGGPRSSLVLHSTLRGDPLRAIRCTLAVLQRMGHVLLQVTIRFGPERDSRVVVSFLVAQPPRRVMALRIFEIADRSDKLSLARGGCVAPRRHRSPKF